mgnify:CR=1 FL=1
MTVCRPRAFALALLALWPATALGVAVDGRVRDAARGEPIAGARVELAAQGGAEVRRATRAGIDGRFRLDAPAGVYLLVVDASGYAAHTQVIDLASPVSLDIVLSDAAGETYTVTAKRARAAPVERAVQAEELRRVPGTQGDAIMVVQSLPGAARTPTGTAALILRGSSPRDSKVFIDGVEIPYLFHFGGLVSVYGSDLLESVRLYPGGFGVRYGRARAGIVEVESARAARDRVHGAADLSFIDATALAEGPATAETSLAAAVRRSWIDAVLAATLPDSGETDLTLAPRYYDYQARADVTPAGGRGVWSIMAFGSDDRLEFVHREPRTLLPDEREEFSNHTLFHRVVGAWHLAPSRGLALEVTPHIGFDQTDLRFAENRARQRRGLFGLRAEAIAGDTSASQLRVGVDGLARLFRMDAQIPESFVTGDAQVPGAPDAGDLAGGDTRASVEAAVYAEHARRWRPWLETTSGLRVDGYPQTGEVVADPRLVVRERAWAGTTLHQSVGLYHQPPTEPELDPTFGSPDLDSSFSLQTGAGVEQRLPWRVRVEATVFSSLFYDLAVPESDDRNASRGRELFAPQFGLLGRQENAGRGRAYGLELLVRRDPGKRFHGWLAYTLLRSERQERSGKPWETFVFDQPHNLTLVGSVLIGRGWQAGARFRLVSGNPFTPVDDAFFDADRGRYVRVSGEPYSARMPAFSQLDVRVDKTWRFRAWALDVYLDVQNATMRENPESVVWSYDFARSGYVTGLPILPSLGVRGWF